MWANRAAEGDEGGSVLRVSVCSAPQGPGGAGTKPDFELKKPKEQVGAALPCCISAPIPNQKLFRRVKLFSTMSEPGLQGWASYHS